MTAAYPEREARFGRVGAVEEAIAVLHWESPAGGLLAAALGAMLAGIGVQPISRYRWP